MRGDTNWKNYRFAVTGDWWVLKDKVKISENFRVQHWNTNGIDSDLLGGLRMPPYSPIYDENALGGYAYVTTTDDLNDAMNPLTNMNNTDQYNKGINIMAQMAAEIHFFEGLTLNSSIGVTGNSGTYNSYLFPRQNGNLVWPESELTERFNFSYYPKIENFLTYTNTFGLHNITAMVGNTYEKGAYGRGVEVYGKGFLNDNVRNVTNASESSIRNNYGNQSAYISYFGRINYVMANKYLVTLNMRADGSDKFAPTNRWGYFPSVAVGWKMHEENFFESSTISQLKIRGSYGITGNDAIGQYRYFSSVHSDVTYAFPSHGFGGINYNGATINTLSSPVIRWEETKNLSIGVDLGLFDNKLEINADYFHKDTYDILFDVPQPPSLGMGANYGGGNATVNAASVLNKGFELNVIYKNNVGDLSYNIQGNLTYVDNEVTSLGSGEPYNAGSFGFYSTNRTELGHSIGYFYGFQMDQVYGTQAEVDADNKAARDAAKANDPSLTPEDLENIYYQAAETEAGDIRFYDIDGDGVVTDDDRTDLGSPIPKLNYGFTASVKYNNWDAFMSWTGVSGNKILYEFGYWMEGMIRPFNATTSVEDRWRSESNPGNGVVPRAVKTDPAKNLRMSDRFIYSGSYARMSQLSVGYTIPSELINNTFKGAISNVRFYVSADNLITITNYPGYNPEIGGNNTNRGTDGGTNPVPRTFRIGANVSF
jgi:TonB-linked SusC/RagA family outer membrane protein